MLSLVICLIGGCLVLALPYDNKAGLLIGYYIVSEFKACQSKVYYVLTVTRSTRTRLEICFSWLLCPPTLQAIPKKSQQTRSL